MRTLLIDNYDSFTGNLWQLVARLSGDEPLVVRNDELDWSELSRLEPDAIILSPGPGRPDRRADFGVGLEVLAAPGAPLLGVCLGHQGIAVAFGGEVRRAPEPVHGRVSLVTHDGSELFRAIPETFEAVRYHSLVVAEPLPPDLEAIARTSDGLVMALRHKRAPIWGVQFHPESIGAPHGDRLVANFLALAAAGRTTRAWGSEVRARFDRVIAAPRPRAATEPRLSLLSRRVEHAPQPEDCFVALFADAPTCFWLDTARPDGAEARFSFLGGAQGPLGRTLRYRAKERRVLVTRAGAEEARDETLFDALARELEALRVARTHELPFPFVGGFVGTLSYELKAECGGDAAHDDGAPDAELAFVDRFVAFDHASGAAYLVALADDRGAAEAEAWLDTMAGQLAAVTPAAPLARAAAPVARSVRWARSREAYLDDIARCKEWLAEGESYEICLTTSATVETRVDPLAFYRALREESPAPYAAFLRNGRVTVASSSPERFVRVTPDGVVESKPIKGTARRGATKDEDEALAEGLARGEKTRSENLMIADLLRHELGLVCAVGSVHVPRLMAVESYATVHQLVTTVRGQLRAGLDATDVVRATFPPGSMTGAPKRRTLALIDALEPGPRGIYSGALGYFSADGGADFSVVIRAAIFDGESMRVGAGGAVVALSEAQAERDELELKARALFDALARTPEPRATRP